MLGSICRRLATVFDALESPPMRAWFEHVVVVAAALGFLVHLAAIGGVFACFSAIERSAVDRPRSSA